VRGVALWILALIVGCAPDYGHTAFRCVSSHASDEPPPCPAGQDCYLGRCRRAAPTGQGIMCAGELCGAGDQCCFVEGGTTGCMPANNVCKGGISALCDSIDDCQLHDQVPDYCCADGKSLFCDAHCNNYACQGDGDCPPTAPHCCRPDRATPWGTCSDDSC
jgi:hypothetical protein